MTTATETFSPKYTLAFDGEEELLKTHCGTITVLNVKTGKHWTVRIKRQNPKAAYKPGVRLLGLLMGRDNTKDFKNFAEVRDGELEPGEDRIKVWTRCQTDEQGRKSVFAIRAEILQTIHLLRHFQAKMAGRCRMCNKLLTNPDSIDSGIGPECARHLHLAQNGQAAF